jgi:hypothetical protein
VLDQPYARGCVGLCHCLVRDVIAIGVSVANVADAKTS